MKEIFLEHYKTVEQEAKAKLKEFKRIKDSNELFEEMTFCIFAANSSAEMGLIAVKLLKPVLNNGTIDDYKLAVHKKVRFYNKRAEYLFYNKEKLQELDTDLKDIITKKTPQERREIIKTNFKGFGLKEASHFLRNTGTKGLCIIDKHVLNVMKDLKVIEHNKKILRDKEYYKIEKKIIEFAKENNLDIDVLDL